MPLLYQKRGRWYANLTSYASWGGKCEAMIPSQERHATQDRVVAEGLLAMRLAELERAKRLNPNPVADATRETRKAHVVSSTFAAFAPSALDIHAARGKVTPRHLVDLRHRTRDFGQFMGHTRLEDVDEMHIHEYLGRLTQRGLGEATQRHYLNAISLIYRLASAANRVPKHFNPARDMEDKPQPSAGGTAFLEVHEGAVLLDTAQRLADRNEDFRIAAAAIATGLLTGGRRSEVMGLLVSNINFEGEVISFEPRSDRRMKNRGSARTVPLWPQLAEILREYQNRQLAQFVSGKGNALGYLFPTPKGDAFVKDIGKCFAKVIEVAGLEAKFDHEAWRVLRRTYASARLQTLDGGKPVAEYVVERELGHSDGEMLRRVYGKVGRIRHRAEVVEYRLTAQDAEAERGRVAREARLRKVPTDAIATR